jgi:hypothetical protein
MDDQYLIWSIDHSLWWCENSRGYTDEIERAGRFQKDRARYARMRLHDQEATLMDFQFQTFLFKSI